MKKLFLVAVAVMMTAFSVNAQVKVQSPHPDLDIQIKRCAYASGTVVIDMVITNYGPEETVRLWGSGTGSYYSTTSAYDDEGNIYNSKIITGPIGNMEYGAVRQVMPQDIPLKYRLQISDVNPNATKLTLLKIEVSSDGAMALNKDKPIIIRNLEWVK